MTGAGRTLTYTAFNKVKRVVKGNHTVTFAYGPERARYKRTDEDDKGTMVTTDDAVTTTLYVGNVEKVIAPDGTYVYRRTLAGGVALIIDEYAASHSETGTTTKYLLRDHLGSVSTLVGALGAMVQTLSYDPWGQRRNAADWQALSSLSLMSFDSSMTRRGYTGHEMVDTVGIIHMNGRIYDPKLGRFMQADPVIQFPHYSQSHNRYSYVLNNPLAYTDPSGYFIGKLFKKVFRGLNKVFGDFALFLSIALLAIPVINAWVTTSWCMRSSVNRKLKCLLYRTVPPATALHLAIYNALAIRPALSGVTLSLTEIPRCVAGNPWMHGGGQGGGCHPLALPFEAR